MNAFIQVQEALSNNKIVYVYDMWQLSYIHSVPNGTMKYMVTV